MSKKIEIDLGKQEQIVIGDYTKITEWIKNEMQYWQWLSDSAIIAHSPLNSINNYVTKQFNNLQHTITDAMHAEEPKKSIKVVLTDFYKGNRRLIFSKSTVGSFIKEMHENVGVVEAASATACYLGQPINIQDFKQLLGAVQISAHYAGITNKTPVSVKSSLARLSNTYQEKIANEEEELQRVKLEVLREQKRHQILKKATKKWSRNNLSKCKEQNDKNVNDAITSIHKTEQVYKEFMKIRAPVEYWQTKSEEHSSKAQEYKGWIIWYFPIALILTLVSLYTVGKLFINSDLPFIGISMAVILTTTAFWMGRIIVRLFLSEHHLSIDAKERSIMAKTYLALTNEEAVDKTDREAVLNALFRPTADGIVKDDAAPTWLPSHFITKP